MIGANRCSAVGAPFFFSFDLGHYLRRACGGPFAALVTVGAVPVAVASRLLDFRSNAAQNRVEAISPRLAAARSEWAEIGR